MTQLSPHFPPLFHLPHLPSSQTMSNVDWNSKLVIGQKSKGPKVTKNAADLNGAFDMTTPACHLETDFL